MAPAPLDNSDFLLFSAGLLLAGGGCWLTFMIWRSRQAVTAPDIAVLELTTLLSRRQVHADLAFSHHDFAAAAVTVSKALGWKQVGRNSWTQALAVRTLGENGGSVRQAVFQIEFAENGDQPVSTGLRLLGADGSDTAAAPAGFPVASPEGVA